METATLLQIIKSYQEALTKLATAFGQGPTYFATKQIEAKPDDYWHYQNDTLIIGSVEDITNALNGSSAGQHITVGSHLVSNGATKLHLFTNRSNAAQCYLMSDNKKVTASLQVKTNESHS